MSRRRLLRRGLGVAVVLLAFAVVLPLLADYGEVWGEVKDLGMEELGVLAVATAANLATFGPPLMSVLPGISFGRAFVVTQASTASTYLAPGGAARPVRSWGRFGCDWCDWACGPRRSSRPEG